MYACVCVCVCVHIFSVHQASLNSEPKCSLPIQIQKNFRSDSNIVLKWLVDSRKRTSYGRLSKYGVRMTSPAQSNPDYL